MKKKVSSLIIIVILLLIVSSPLTLNANETNDDITWMKTYGKLFRTEQGKSVVQTDDGGYVFICYGLGLIKVNSIGEIIWEKPWTGKEIITTTDGGYMIICGVTTDIYLLKLDSEGNEEWLKKFGGEDSEIIGVDHIIQQTNDGGYIFTCGTRSFGIDSNNAWLVKTDIYGEEEWNKTYSIGTGPSIGQSVRQTNDGGYIIGGYIYCNYTMEHHFLIKTDPFGDEEWSRIYYKSKDYVRCNSVCQTYDGGYILSGYINLNGFIMKTDPLGNIEWNKTFNQDMCRNILSMDYTDDNGFILVGINGIPLGYSDVCLIKLNEYGSIEWNKKIGQSDVHEEGYCVKQTYDGGFIIAGKKHNGKYIMFFEIFSDAWLIKTDSMGNAEKIDSSYPIINMI